MATRASKITKQASAAGSADAGAQAPAPAPAAAAARTFVVLNTMLGTPSGYYAYGDLVPEAVLGDSVARLLELNAIALVEEGLSAQDVISALSAAAVAPAALESPASNVTVVKPQIVGDLMGGARE